MTSATKTATKTASWGVLGMLAVAQFILVLDTTVMNVSITQVAEDLNTTIVGMQTRSRFTPWSWHPSCCWGVNWATGGG